MCTCDLSQFYPIQPGKCRHGVIMPIRHRHTHLYQHHPPCSQDSLSHTHNTHVYAQTRALYLCEEIPGFHTSVPTQNQLFSPFVMKVNFYNRKLCVRWHLNHPSRIWLSCNTATVISFFLIRTNWQQHVIDASKHAALGSNATIKKKQFFSVFACQTTAR